MLDSILGGTALVISLILTIIYFRIFHSIFIKFYSGNVFIEIISELLGCFVLAAFTIGLIIQAAGGIVAGILSALKWIFSLIVMLIKIGIGVCSVVSIIYGTYLLIKRKKRDMKDSNNSVQHNDAENKDSICPNCGAILEKDAEICTFCGHSIEALDEDKKSNFIEEDRNKLNLIRPILCICIGCLIAGSMLFNVMKGTKENIKETITSTEMKKQVSSIPDETTGLKYNETVLEGQTDSANITESIRKNIEESIRESIEESIRESIEDIANVQKSEKNIEKQGQGILPYSSSRSLLAVDVDSLSKEELRIAVNEIYARKGRLFKDAEIQTWFNNQPWYHGTIAPEDFDEKLLSHLEKENIAFLQQKLEDISAEQEEKTLNGLYETQFGSEGGATLEIANGSRDDMYTVIFSGSYYDQAGYTDGYLVEYTDGTDNIWEYYEKYSYESGNFDPSMRLEYDGTNTIVITSIDGQNFGGMRFPGFSGTYTRMEEYPMP